MKMTEWRDVDGRGWQPHVSPDKNLPYVAKEVDAVTTKTKDGKSAPRICIVVEHELYTSVSRPSGRSKPG